MNPELTDIERLADRAAPFLDRLARLYEEMDRACAAVADRYGFRCRGCDDNCCRSRFHHHTVAEYLYIGEGLRGMPHDDRAEVRRRAAAAVPGDLCPVNDGVRCRIYAHRPMICRLHGVAHETRRPDGRVLTGPGCDLFTETAGGRDRGALDRTPFYQELARLEGELRAELGLSGRPRLTVGEIIQTLQPEPSEASQ